MLAAVVHFVLVPLVSGHWNRHFSRGLGGEDLDCSFKYIFLITTDSCVCVGSAP